MGRYEGISLSIALVADASDAETHAFRQTCAAESYRVGAEADAPGCIGVLLLGAGRADAASQRMRRRDEVFTLLVSHDSSVLQRVDLLERCENILVAPFDDGSLRQTLRAVRQHAELDPGVYENIVGRSPQIRELLRVMSIMARNDAPVLINGETGTGKELVARGIHYSSARRDQPFVPVNCGALNDELLLAELFGYEKGAFTDAKRAHQGLVDQAAGGVLFLDELDSLSLRGQAALLRFLQEQEYRPLGGAALLKADVRIITASNKDLAQLVAQERFREDLYYRVRLLDLVVPPLRARTGDVEVLAEYFLRRLGGGGESKQLHPLTRQWMTQYEWPGNVRELQNFLHRVFLLSRGPTIFVPRVKGDPLGVHGLMQGALCAPGEQASMQSFNSEKVRVLESFEREYLNRVMKAANGNTSLAARFAGKERRAFRRLLQRYGIDRKNYAGEQRR